MPTFASPSLETEYQVQLVTEKIRLTRMLAILGVVLNLCFVVLDPWAIPSALEAVWGWRATIIIALAIAFASTWLPVFPALYSAIIVMAFAVMATAINAMIYLARPGEAAIDQYYGGLLLIIIGLHTLTYLNLWLALALSLAMLAGYAAIAALLHDYTTGTTGVVLVANLFVGVSATIIGMVAQALRDRYARENYLLRHSLQRDVEIKDEEARRASYLAEHDPLTGLANRLCFERETRRLLDDADRHGCHVAVMFIDLDNLKPINDSHGHAVGDRVLRVVAERLRARLRSADVCARLGGDEFVVAMSAAAGEPEAFAATAERLARAIAADIDVRGAVLRISASIGIAGYPADGSEMEELLRRADERMYGVKRHGKDGIGLPPAWQQAPARTVS